MAPRRVLYSSPFVPAEWIAAHGLEPCRAFPSGHANALTASANEGLCPFAKAFVGEVAAGVAAASVFATTCDQMRRASELAERGGSRPVFLLNVPATWRTAAARDMYRGELARLGRFLVGLGGTVPSAERLATVMGEYDDARAALRDARGAMSARAAAEALAALSQEGPGAMREWWAGHSCPAGPGLESPGYCARLALVGGPLLRDQFVLYDELENAGLRIVLDATETGERALPAPFERGRLRDDPCGELARAYFEQIPDVFRRPNDLLYEWLARELAVRRVQGIVLLRCVWCDLWHAEAQRLKGCWNMPVVELDPSGATAAGLRTQARLQALREMFM